MKKFKVTIEGNNLNILIENTVQKCGFFTTRFIEAGSLYLAENTALSLIHKELKDIVLNNENDSPSIFVDHLEEINSFGDSQVPGIGFTWYLDESS